MLVVHDVPYLLRVPYWFDEAWVAVSTRVSLGHLTTVTETSPTGWTFLLRLMPTNGQQDQRLLPLLLAGLTVLAAYGFGRTLRLLPVVTGLLAGGAALLVPAMLVRDDLKQYTADAFVAMLVFALLSRLEATWTRGRLAALSAVLVLSALVSQVTFLLAFAVFGCLGAVLLVRRRWAELTETIAAGALCGAVLAGIFFVFDRATQTEALKQYWAAYYVSRHPSAVTHYISTHIHQLLPYFGIRHAVLLVLLVLLGLGVLAGQRRWATASLLPALAIIMVGLSSFQKYPPGDVVLVSLGASYGYGYYSPLHPEIVGTQRIGYWVSYPAAARTIVLSNRRPVDVQTGLARATSLLAQHSGAHLWIVLNHVAPIEAGTWDAGINRLHAQTIWVASQTFVYEVPGP